MLEVCEDQQTGSEVFLLAVHYMDTFLSSVSISKSQFQLCAASCLLLASKFQAVVPLSAIQLAIYTDNSITPEELRQWELIILRTLQWELSVITPRAVISHLLPSLRLPHSSLCDTLILHAVSSFSASCLPPSLIAAAAVFTAEYDAPSHSLLYSLSQLTRHSEENICRVSSYLASLAGLPEIHRKDVQEERESGRPVTPKETLEVCESLITC